MLRTRTRGTARRIARRRHQARRAHSLSRTLTKTTRTRSTKTWTTTRATKAWTTTRTRRSTTGLAARGMHGTATTGTGGTLARSTRGRSTRTAIEDWFATLNSARILRRRTNRRWRRWRSCIDRTRSGLRHNHAARWRSRLLWHSRRSRSNRGDRSFHRGWNCFDRCCRSGSHWGGSHSRWCMGGRRGLWRRNNGRVGRPCGLDARLFLLRRGDYRRRRCGHDCGGRTGCNRRLLSRARNDARGLTRLRNNAARRRLGRDGRSCSQGIRRWTRRHTRYNGRRNSGHHNWRHGCYGWPRRRWARRRSRRGHCRRHVRRRNWGRRRLLFPLLNRLEHIARL